MFSTDVIKEENNIGKDNSPVIFDISYTPYRLKKNATQKEIDDHAKERSFYDMTGDNNIYRYMVTDGKVFGNEADKYTILEYLQKSTGVFNQDGPISKEEVKAIKQRAQDKDKCLWHGFISFNEEDSKLINTPDKCIDLIKKTFRQFFKDAGFDPDNMDLMCALHLDRPKHLHIHYLFFEKEPKIKNKRAAGYIYRKKGKIKFDAIEKMTERLNAYTLNDELEERRQEVISHLKKDFVYDYLDRSDKLKNMLLKLADELPICTRYSYASKDMIPYRDKIDNVVNYILANDASAKIADRRFKEEVELKKVRLQSKMGQSYKKEAERELHFVQNWEGYSEIVEGMRNLHTIEAIEFDYRRRLGNIVLRHAEMLKKETYKRNPKRKYSTNNKRLKRSIRISTRKTNAILDEFLFSVTDMFVPQAEMCRNRLQEIEEEMEQKEQESISEARRKKYSWGKAD